MCARADQIRTRLAQVVDGEPLRVERVVKLRGDEREPAAEIAADEGEAVAPPAAILRDLSALFAFRSALRRVADEEFELPRRARRAADDEVPSRVRRDDGAAIHHPAVA